MSHSIPGYNNNFYRPHGSSPIPRNPNFRNNRPSSSTVKPYSTGCLVSARGEEDAKRMNASIFQSVGAAAAVAGVGMAETGVGIAVGVPTAALGAGLVAYGTHKSSQAQSNIKLLDKALNGKTSLDQKEMDKLKDIAPQCFGK